MSFFRGAAAEQLKTTFSARAARIIIMASLNAKRAPSPPTVEPKEFHFLYHFSPEVAIEFLFFYGQDHG
jgi:hypothetical protein